MRILRNLRVASQANTTVLLVELVIPEHDRDFIGKWADLEMLLGATAVSAPRRNTARCLDAPVQDDAGGADGIAVQFGRGEAGLTVRG